MQQRQKSFTTDDEVDVIVTYNIVSWGHPGSMPSRDHPGDPPEPAEVEIIDACTDEAPHTKVTLSDKELLRMEEAIIEDLDDTDYDPD